MGNACKVLLRAAISYAVFLGNCYAAGKWLEKGRIAAQEEHSKKKKAQE